MRFHSAFCPLHGPQHWHLLSGCTPHRTTCSAAVSDIDGDGKKIKRPCLLTLVWRDDNAMW